MAGELEGRVSIVTGGGSGMGRATSLLLAREGAAVAIADVNDEGGEQTAAQIEDLGGDALFMHTDVSSETDVVSVVSETAARFGRLDSMVTAAGISYANYVEGDDDTDPFLHPEAASNLNRPTEFWRKVLDVNLTGVMLCAREAARQMVNEGHGGAIVNFASINAYNPSPLLTDYSVSKAGVVMLTRCFAAEFGPRGIRVNAVAPGPIETPMLARVHRATRGSADPWGNVPLQRTADPDEVAEAVLFLTSDRSSYVTGKTLGVDGGIDTV